MYTERRNYENGLTLTIATSSGGVWQIEGSGQARGSTASGQSRVEARARADALAGARPADDWSRVGEPSEGDEVPCGEDGCVSLARCEFGANPRVRGTSAGLGGGAALYLRCHADDGHVEVLRLVP